MTDRDYKTRRGDLPRFLFVVKVMLFFLLPLWEKVARSAG
jgi:hypothetical protein